MISFAVPSITREEINKVGEVLESGWITTGKLTREFGEKIASKIGAKYCLPVNSCTAALHLALICAGVKKGDEVITTPMTFVSTINVIKYLGAIPVLVDIKPNDYIIDEEKIEAAITKHTKVIMPVHYGGYSANLGKIRAIAKKHKLEIIEDAAHAYGSKYKEEFIGQNSKFACFSFYPTKNITTIEGGALVTNNKEVYERASSLALHGISKDAWKRYTKEGSWRYDVMEMGYKYNMTDVQAAVGLVQLERMDELHSKRKEIYQYYVDNLKNIRGIEVLPGNEYSDPFIHLFVVKLDPSVIGKDQFIAKMKERDIVCSVHFIPVYEFSAYKQEFAKTKKSLKVTASAHISCVSLPFSSAMTLVDAKVVIEAIKQIFSLSPDVFLTNILHTPVYNVSGLDSTIKYEKNNIYSCITPYEKGLVGKYEMLGFVYISSRVEMFKECSTKRAVSRNKNLRLTVVYATDDVISKTNLREIQQIGREIAETSRFYKDVLIGDKAYVIYDKWIENSLLHGYASDYIVVREGKIIVGFATLRDTPDLILDLIGVKKEYQGHGVGQLLIEAIERKYSGQKLRTGTEAENIQGMNFYARNGFKIENYKLVFHQHA